MTHYMNCWWLKYGVRMVGKWMIPTVPFKEAYFLEDALKIQNRNKGYSVSICRRVGFS